MTTYTPADAITYLVDAEALSNLVNACAGDDTRVGLIGFNEYSKNVINSHPARLSLSMTRSRGNTASRSAAFPSSR
jgi:hypothetical protein